MSKMGDFVLDVQERYSAGDTPEQISEALRVPLEMVKDAIWMMAVEPIDDWPEPDQGF